MDNAAKMTYFGIPTPRKETISIAVHTTAVQIEIQLLYYGIQGVLKLGKHAALCTANSE